MRPYAAVFYFVAALIWGGLAFLSTPAAAQDSFLVVTLGDSLTEKPYVQQLLAERLSDPVFFNSPMPSPGVLRNHAKGGWETNQVWDGARDGNWGAEEGADIVFIMAGTNDNLHGYVGGEDIESQAEAMIKNIQRTVNEVSGSDPFNRPRIVVSAILPTLSGDMNQRAKYYNEHLYQSLTGVDVFIETNWYDFYDAANDQVRAEYMDDRLHPNTDGYYMMAENIFEGIGALFDPQVTVDNPYVHRMSGYGGWHLVSAIGDDLTEAMYMQDVLRERLGHPLGFSSPATESKLSAHGLSGSYVGSIQDQVISQNWGDGEGAEYVLVMAGLNDMVWGQQNGADPAGHAAEVVSQVQGIINEASGGDPNNPNRPRVIVSALPPSQDAGLNQHIQAYNQALASSLIGADLFIETNWYDIVDGQSGLAQGGLMTDFILPNGDGYYRIAENWFEALGALRDPGIADNNPYIHRQSVYRQIN